MGSTSMRIAAFLAVLLCATMIASPIDSYGSPDTTQCIYSLLGFLVSAESSKCPTTGTPTVVSQAYGHASPQNGLLQYDERLYFDDMNYPHGCPECFNQWSQASEKAKLCKYDKDGNFWYPLTGDQKKVLLDLQENYTFFVCPFVGNHTATQPLTSPPVTVPDGTTNVTNMSITNEQASTIRQWAGPNPTITDAVLLREMNMSGTYIPAWVKTIARWTIGGEVTRDDFLNALEYLSKIGATGGSA